MASEPQDMPHAWVELDDDEIILAVGPGDHTCQRFRITKDSFRLMVAEGVSWLLTGDSA